MIRLTSPARYSTLVVTGDYTTGNVDNGNYSISRTIRFSPHDPIFSKKPGLDVTYRGILKSCAGILGSSSANYHDTVTKITHLYTVPMMNPKLPGPIYATHHGDDKGRMEILADNGEQLILTQPEERKFGGSSRDNTWEYMFEGNPDLIHAVLYSFICSNPQGYGPGSVQVSGDRIVVSQCRSCD